MRRGCDPAARDGGGALKHASGLGTLLLVCLQPIVASGQPVAIEHEGLACMVAGRFPVLGACFRPGRELARARVYFRPEGISDWYYVEASLPAPPKPTDPPGLLCRQATLPRPKKVLLQTHVEYYVEALGKGLESSQTETYRPLVVKDPDECKDRAVAPFVPSAAAPVFPSLPAGFAAGGLSGAALAAVVGAGVAGVTGTVLVVTGGGGAGVPTTQPPIPTTQPAAPPTPPPTLAPAAAFNAVFKVFRDGGLETQPRITGTEPMPLRFFMCESSGPLPLRFSVAVNGAVTTVGCDSTITFTARGFTPGFGAPGVRGAVHTATTSYDVVMLVRSDSPNNDPQASQGRVVELRPVPVPTTTTLVPTTTTTTTTSTSTTTTTSTSTTTLAPDPCRADRTPPAVTLLSPPPLSNFNELDPSTFPVPFRADASDANGVATVEYLLDVLAPSGTGLLPIPGAVVSKGSPYPFDWPLAGVQRLLGANCITTAHVVARATDACGNVADARTSGAVSFHLPVTCRVAPASFYARPDGVASPAPAENFSAWVSQLEVPGGRGQFVLNGSQAFFPGPGRSSLPVRLQAGENRVEAMLVQAEGEAGLWRFEPGGERGLTPGSLRVIAGQVALVTPDAVVFRMKGRAGERVVFTFRASPWTGR